MLKFSFIYRQSNESLQLFDRWFFSFSLLKWYDSNTRSLFIGSKFSGNHNLLVIDEVKKSVYKTLNETVKRQLLLNQFKKLGISERLALNLVMSEKVDSFLSNKVFDSFIPVIAKVERLETKSKELKVSKFCKTNLNFLNVFSSLYYETPWFWVYFCNKTTPFSIRFRILSKLKSGYLIRFLNQQGFLPASQVLSKRFKGNLFSLSIVIVTRCLVGRSLNLGTCLQFNSQLLNIVVSITKSTYQKKWEVFFIYQVLAVLKEIDEKLKSFYKINFFYLITKKLLNEKVSIKCLKLFKLQNDIILIGIKKNGRALLIKRLSVLV